MNKKGTILVVTMLLIVAMFLFGTALILLTQSNVKTLSSELFAKRSLYITEAGIERAIYELEQDSDWSDATPGDDLYSDESLSYSVGGVTFFGTYSVVLSSRSVNDITITSTGVVNGLQRTIKVRVTR